jgi:hypothetical protein
MDEGVDAFPVVEDTASLPLPTRRDRSADLPKFAN